jgi:hypothetical protein
MGVDGAQANHEAFCDLGIGQAFCYQAQHLDFASRQPGGIGRGTLCRGFRGTFRVPWRLGGNSLCGRHGTPFRQLLCEGGFSQVGTSRRSHVLVDGLWDGHALGFW